MVDELIIENILHQIREHDGQMDMRRVLRETFNGDIEKHKAHVRRMRAKGLAVVRDNENHPHELSLTDYGWTFPGFAKEREELANKQKLENDQMKSVISTNNTQKIALWLTLFVSAITLFITFYSSWKQKPINVFPSEVIIQQIPSHPDTGIQQQQKRRFPKDST